MVIYRHLIISILLLNIAFSLDFSKCEEYYLNASKDFSGINALHLGDGLYLAYSNKQIQNDKIIKSSPIFGLYLFKDEALAYKFDLKEIKNDIKVVAINKDSIVHGEILQKQNSIKDLAIFSKNMQQNSVISDICYQIYGISTNDNKFITKKYIDLFLQTSTNDIISTYSYIGIEINNKLEISKINPLIIKNIKIGDKIESINDKKIESSNDFFDEITILPPNTQIKIKINNISYLIKTLPLNSSFDIQGTYLEALGIAINKDLVIINNPTNKNFKQGDRILNINKIRIKNINDIDSAIDSTLEDSLNILVLRRNFEFFINIQKPLNIDRNINEKDIN
ncbi:hypothetical protein [Helicobacter sp. MIT 99-5507]|uniref:DUF7488 domain-containing protein n=1 Tax=Helicobacter sp. MIT 99-5507 TaxID=152489 RepID=UPI000E1E8879|nr:hypothetical protein [Helicobacter sp. MIT 99-5507]RDU57349.1 hypothetical protein CQA42_05260 [Helicobacter sp. MIT 99-5507]